MIFQLAVAFCLGVLIWLLWGFRAGASVWVGGLTCAIPHLYFARRFFNATGALATKQIVRGMYRAEMIKLLLTGLLFMVVFKFLPIDILAFFVGFIVVQLTAWVSPLIIKFNTQV
jgi:ATP synthase protein I